MNRGRPTKKTAWQSSKRYSFTVSFTEYPAVHTFLELYGTKDLLVEFDRLLVETEHFSALRETQISIAQSALGLSIPARKKSPTMKEFSFSQPIEIASDTSFLQSQPTTVRTGSILDDE